MSMVTAPPGPACPLGGGNTISFSFSPSTLTTTPWGPTSVTSLGFALDHSVPWWSMTNPWDIATKSGSPGSGKFLTFPVLVSIRPIVRRALSEWYANQMFPFRSSCASCTPRKPFNPDGGPSDQLLPSFWGTPPSICLSHDQSTGTSYSVKTTRAASPVGRGWVLNFIGDGPGPRIFARYAANSFSS